MQKTPIYDVIGVNLLLHFLLSLMPRKVAQTIAYYTTIRATRSTKNRLKSLVEAVFHY